LSRRILEEEEIITGLEGNLYANRQDNRALSYSMIAFDILERFSPSPQHSMLEVCCGAGHLAHFLYQYSGNKNIIASDGSKELINAAKKTYKEDPIRFKVQNLNRNTFQEKNDLVICMDSFHHFKDPVHSLRQLMKLVKAGGNLYIIDLTRSCSIDLVKKRKEAIRNSHEQARFLRSINASFTYGEMETNLALAGEKKFRIIYPRKFSQENVAHHAEWISRDPVKEHLYEGAFLICLINKQ
jgi:ubiquinone/menaquinone biosynthesis C-methylase UbiE